MFWFWDRTCRVLDLVMSRSERCFKNNLSLVVDLSCVGLDLDLCFGFGVGLVALGSGFVALRKVTEK